MPLSRAVVLAVLFTSFTDVQNLPHVERSYNIRSELVGVPFRIDAQSDAPRLDLGTQLWQSFQFSWVLIRFISKNCCQEYTLLRSDTNYLVQFKYENIDVIKCEPQLDTFQLFFLDEDSTGNVKGQSNLQANNGTIFLQEWNLIRANSSVESTSRTSTSCLNDHFHLMISQEAVEEWTPMAGEETNLPVVLVASKDGKHGLEGAVSENESDGLIMIVIPVTCCYWIYLGVCTVFRKMCGKCAR